MSKKLILGIGLVLSSAGGFAQITGYREWPIAAAGQMLTAIGGHDQKLLDRVIAPGAIYFAGYEAEQGKRSTLLSLDSFANVRNRCQVGSVHACNSTAATIEWFCPSAPKNDQSVWSTVRLDESGHIASVTGDTGPLVCMEAPPPPERGL